MNSRADYLARRKELIDTERALRFDAVSRQHASPEEHAACVGLSNLKRKEHDTFWDDDKKPSVHRNMPFLESRPRMEASQLFRHLKQMPKGALLHGHLDAMAPTEFLLHSALQHSEMLFIKASRPVEDFDLTDRHPREPVSLSFTYLSKDKAATATVPDQPNLYASDYQCGFVPIRLAREQFPGGPAAFDQFVVAQMSLPSSRLASSQHTWEHFTNYFLTSASLLQFEPVFRAYVSRIIDTAVQDGISYLELRMNFFTGSANGVEQIGSVMLNPEATAQISHTQQLHIIQECIDAAVSKYGSDRFWGLKIIYSTLKFVKGSSASCTPGFEKSASVRAFMEECLELKQKFPRLIAAFDLVGQEDIGVPLVEYLDDLLWFKERQKEVGVDVPYCFHAGETAFDGGYIDENLYDAILLGTKRIGHGFALAKHPHLMKVCKDNGILIEVCPISNQLLGYVSSIANHPLSILLSHGVPCALSNDDPAVFTNHGLTYDTYQFFNNTDAFDLLSIQKLCLQSIEHTLLSPEEKATCLKRYEQQWAAFIAHLKTQLQDS